MTHPARKLESQCGRDRRRVDLAQHREATRPHMIQFVILASAPNGLDTVKLDITIYVKTDQDWELRPIREMITVAEQRFQSASGFGFRRRFRQRQLEHHGIDSMEFSRRLRTMTPSDDHSMLKSHDVVSSESFWNWSDRKSIIRTTPRWMSRRRCSQGFRLDPSAAGRCHAAPAGGARGDHRSGRVPRRLHALDFCGFTSNLTKGSTVKMARTTASSHQAARSRSGRSPSSSAEVWRSFCFEGNVGWLGEQ